MRTLFTSQVPVPTITRVLPATSGAASSAPRRAVELPPYLSPNGCRDGFGVGTAVRCGVRMGLRLEPDPRTDPLVGSFPQVDHPFPLPGRDATNPTEGFPIGEREKTPGVPW